LFQPEAPGDGDGAVAVASVEGEPSVTELIVEAQAQADILMEDAETIAETEKTEVCWSEVRCL
jgi:hypothetical protein